VTLRARLTAAFLAVVLGPVLLGAVFVGLTVSEVSTKRATEHLEMAATTVRTTVGAACHELRSAASTAALLYGQGEHAGAAKEALQTGLATAISITDTTGRTLSSAGASAGPLADCGEPSGDESTAPASLAAQVSITDTNGQPLGEAIATMPVNAHFASRLASAAGVDVTLLAGRTPVSTEQAKRARAVADLGRKLTGDHLGTTPDGQYIRHLAPVPNQPLSLALSTARTDSQGLYAVLVGVVVLAGLLAVGAAWWLANSTTRPLAELATAADRVAGGDLDARVPVRARDEVGRVGSSFNRMTVEMQAYVRALTASRDQLRNNLSLLGDTLSSTHDLDKILTVILETAMAATGARAGVVALIDRSEGHYPGVLVAQAADGPKEIAEPLAALRLPLGEGLLGEVAASGEPRRGRLEDGDRRLSDREPRCRTYIAVPFSGGSHGDGRGETELGVAAGSPQGRLLGVLALYDRLGADDFDDADLGTLRTFAGQAAVAVENVLLHQEAERLSLTDPLTELWNYRYLKVSLHREIERANRFGRNLAVLALDLDRFKDVNDNYGHAAGDAVLVAFANRILHEIREVDLAFRQGGEEFVVLLPETDGPGGLKVAQRLCETIRRMPIPLHPAAGGSEPMTLSVTVSIGVAVYPEHGGSQEVLEAADDALYAAKAGGRDTARLAGTPVTARNARRRAGRRTGTDPLLRVIDDEADPDTPPDPAPAPPAASPPAPPPPVSGGESHRPRRPAGPGGG
jgi:two-component system cell cycle response regulator